MPEVKKRGRPRKTDPEKALQNALTLFWKKGFEATSLADLVAATGMAKPSLYATFGDKEAFFMKALTHYVDEAGAPIKLQLAQPVGSTYEDLKAYLITISESVSDDTQPNGCFLINSMIDSENLPRETKPLFNQLRQERTDALIERMRLGQKTGDFPEDADVPALADFLWGQTVALAVLGRTGEEQAILDRIIETALTAVPRP